MQTRGEVGSNQEKEAEPGKPPVLANGSTKGRWAIRAFWAVTAILVAVALGVGASWVPVGVVIMSPGPTVNVLGNQGDTPVLEFSQSGEAGEVPLPEEAKSEGQLRMVTVSSIGGPGTTARLGNLVEAWFSPSSTVRKYSDLYGPETTAEQVQQAGAAQMESSHSAAAIAAMDYLGYPMSTTLTIVGVSPASGASGKLEDGDTLVAITTPDGRKHMIDSPSVPFKLMETVPAGSQITVTIARDGEEHEVELVTTAKSDLDGGETGEDEEESEETESEKSAEQTQGSKMGIYLTADTELPIEVKIHLEKIGGPSAGLVFALGIIDELTPGGIVGDQVVAATGALDFAGNVVAIGGIKQKMYGAVRDGAKWFLTPSDNCEDVLGNIPDGLEVVPVATLAEGVNIVEKIAQGEVADLPSCESQTP